MRITLVFLFFTFYLYSNAQQISGYWHNNSTKAFGPKYEVKVVLKGDSLVGTSYYYYSKNKYTKYSIKGYFDAKTNAVIWWDDQLLENKNTKIGILPNGENPPIIMEANFSCPGGGVMKLEGDVKMENKKIGAIDLKKVEEPVFEDSYNEIIDNWTVGGNNPQYINEAYKREISKITGDKLIPKQEDKTIVYKETKTPTEKVTELDLPVKKQESVAKNTEQAKSETKQPVEFLDVNKPKVTDTQKETSVVTQETPQPKQPIEFLDVNKPKATMEKPKQDVATDNKPKEETAIAKETTEPKKPIEFLDINKPKATTEKPKETIAIVENKPKSETAIVKQAPPIVQPKPVATTPTVVKPTAPPVVTQTPKPEPAVVKQVPPPVVQPKPVPATPTVVKTSTPVVAQAPKPTIANEPNQPKQEVVKTVVEQKNEVAKAAIPEVKKEPTLAEQKLTAQLAEREKKVLAELPIADSIEFFLYDNAEVDGDSVSLFLNNVLLYKHIMLRDRPFIFKLYRDQLVGNDVTLTMLAENLGAIPPNTSYMKAIANGKKYEATLSSTEQTSAVIRFKKE